MVKFFLTTQYIKITGRQNKVTSSCVPARRLSLKLCTPLSRETPQRNNSFSRHKENAAYIRNDTNRATFGGNSDFYRHVLSYNKIFIGYSSSLFLPAYPNPFVTTYYSFPFQYALCLNFII